MSEGDSGMKQDRHGMSAGDGGPNRTGKDMIERAICPARVYGIPDRRIGGLFWDAIWSDTPRGKKRGPKPKPKQKQEREPVIKREPVKYAGFDNNGKFCKLKKFNYFTGLRDDRTAAPKQVKQTIEIYR